MASKAFGLATFPLLLSELDIADYGTLDLFGYCLALASVFAVFGLDSALGRLLHDHTEDVRPRFVSTVLMLQGGYLCVVVPMLIIMAWLLLPGESGANNNYLFAGLLVLQLPFAVAYSLAVALSQWTFARSAYLRLTLGFTAAQASAIVVGVLCFDLTAFHVALLTASTTVIFGILGIIYLRRYFVWTLDRSCIASVLRFAWPLGAIGILGAVSPIFERSIVLSQLGPSELGMYAIASKFASMMALVSAAFQTAWGPFAVAVHQRRDGSRKLFASALWLVTVGMVSGAFGLAALVGPILVALSASAYLKAVPLVLPLALAAGVSATAAVMQVGLLLSKRSYLNLLAELAFSISLLTLAGLAVPYLGSTGVATATLVANVFRCVLLFGLSDRLIDDRKSNVNVWLFILCASVVCLLLSDFGLHPDERAFSAICAATSVLSGLFFIYLIRSIRKRA